MVTGTSSAIRPSKVRRTVQAIVGVVLCTAVVALAQARSAEDADDELAELDTSAAPPPWSDSASVFALAQDRAVRLDAPKVRLSLEGHVEPLAGVRPQVVQGGISTRLIDVSNRVWLGYGRAAFGVGFGAQTVRVEPPLGLSESLPVQPTRPSLSVGWRYRFTPTSQFYAGATAARAWGSVDDLPRYNARAGVEWKVAKSRIGFESGRLGLQLDSGYRMSIRTRSGGVQLALRRTF